MAHVDDPNRPLDPASPELLAVFDRIASDSRERERDRVAPQAEIDLLRTARFGALRLPVAEGGADVSVRELFSLIIALAAADANVAHILRSHFIFVELVTRLTPRRQRWVEEIATGKIFAGAATESGPGALGSVNPNTKLRQTRDGYRLNGTKYYSTGSLYADWLIFTATDELDQLVTAIVPATRPGVVLGDDWDGLGQRLTGSGTTELNDVLVEAGDLLDAEEQAIASPRFAFAQLYLTAVIAGIMRAVVEDAIEVIRGREGRPFGHAAHSPSQDPLLQQVVGDLSAAAFAGEAAVLAAADTIDRETAAVSEGVADPVIAEEASADAARAKVIVDEAAVRAATRLFDVGGASATKQTANLDRHWRNARTVASHNPALLKAQAVGDLLINDSPLPPNWFF